MNYFAGVAVPVFSLRSDDSFGVGEFNDLKKLADWCVVTGLKMIQILPVNDTTTDGGWSDSYPYKSISTKALHPIYLNLEKVGILKDENERLRFNEIKKELNAKEFVDYPAVFKAKMDYLKKIFEIQNDFKNFYDFLQYHCDKQLTESVDYLHSKGIILKGDLPIGVNRESEDVKRNPQLFNLDMETGAPPDAFAAEGQNWGFPTYNWDEMAKDDFAWWRSRVKWFERYFDALRIDHILGFFRIWEIPKGSPNASFGHYSPTDPIRWETEGRNRLSRVFGLSSVINHETCSGTSLRLDNEKIEHTSMLICGEDLGMVAPCVPGVMRELGILSLEVQRMPKNSGRPFGDPRENPYLSVDTTGTHDMPTIRGWWEENREISSRFYHEMLHHTDEAPYFCEPYICREIIEQHMRSASQWVIIPIQDYIAMDGDFRWDCTWEEQINNPADPNHKWRYRMHQSLEQLLGNEKLNAMMRCLTQRQRK